MMLRCFAILTFILFVHTSLCAQTKITTIDFDTSELKDQLDLIIADDCKKMAYYFIDGGFFSSSVTFYPVFNIQSYSTPVSIFFPVYKEGFFCNFEDNINRNRKLRIDFGTD
ncbi:MAG: hypothetical protein H7Y00_15695 [Fimbriimonadaceae bacterium]|nr:hypothetical protein [Chitinophagales bacterium]